MRPLRVLHLASGKDDVRPVERELEHNGWAVEWRRVETAEGFREALHRPWDVILSDYSVPRFGALEALEV
ncbi:MAG TPA: histidine kinase, partial [Myxococcaceae bacterium]